MMRLHHVDGVRICWTVRLSTLHRDWFVTLLMDIDNSPGALAVTLGCPVLTYSLYFLCGESGCPSQAFYEAPLEYLRAQWPGVEGVYSATVLGYYCVWFFGLVALQFILPGRESHGVLLKDGSRLKYKLNGLLTCAVYLKAVRLIFCIATETIFTIMAYCGFMTWKEGVKWQLWGWIWDNYIYLLTASIVFATAQASYVYVSSFYTGEVLADHGNTGNMIYDVWSSRVSPRWWNSSANTQYSGLSVGLLIPALGPGILKSSMNSARA